MQTTPPDSLSLKFQDPEDCSASKCKTFVGMERNGGNKEYLNFYLEGEASAWVAVGFSKTESMVRAECTMQLCSDPFPCSFWLKCLAVRCPLMGR